MAGRVYPNKVVAPVSALGYDGADFHTIYLDKQSDGDHSLRISTLPDRVSTYKSAYISASYGNHGLTERARYTCPAGKRALLMAVYTFVGIPEAAGTAQVKVGVNGYILCVLNVTSATVQPANNATFPFQIWLNVGDYVTVETSNSTSDTLLHRGYTHISEYDA